MMMEQLVDRSVLKGATASGSSTQGSMPKVTDPDAKKEDDTLLKKTENKQKALKFLVAGTDGGGDVVTTLRKDIKALQDRQERLRPDSARVGALMKKIEALETKEKTIKAKVVGLAQELKETQTSLVDAREELQNIHKKKPPRGTNHPPKQDAEATEAMKMLTQNMLKMAVTRNDQEMINIINESATKAGIMPGEQADEVQTMGEDLEERGASTPEGGDGYENLDETEDDAAYGPAADPPKRRAAPYRPQDEDEKAITEVFKLAGVQQIDYWLVSTAMRHRQRSRRSQARTSSWTCRWST
eukprot:TRINITY_DN58058_c0_g1_i1.p2 TRINITY_DN58058_c0_g1~~TRINITY_DN58058_c0_g1_i1.p2  ORF type:complete len:300 (-),score=87.01 TRINITY_DN58058_c0_g1_i1:611-1510(-)